jgi:MerR family transcriptional regulator, copper efflux regulator
MRAPDNVIMKTFFIGELADRFGLNPRTIRYYERIGVLTKAARSEGGYRLYSQDSAARLEFVLKAKTLGLTLEEIRRILSLHDEGVVPCEHTRDFVRRKVQEADEKIAALQALKKTLSKALKSRFRKHSASFCPIIEEAGTKRIALLPAKSDGKKQRRAGNGP